jgi:hypothetical protein
MELHKIRLKLKETKNTVAKILHGCFLFLLFNLFKSTIVICETKQNYFFLKSWRSTVHKELFFFKPVWSRIHNDHFQNNNKKNPPPVKLEVDKGFFGNAETLK